MDEFDPRHALVSESLRTYDTDSSTARFPVIADRVRERMLSPVHHQEFAHDEGQVIHHDFG